MKLISTRIRAVASSPFWSREAMSRLICFTTTCLLFLSSFILATAIFAAVLLFHSYPSEYTNSSIKLQTLPTLKQIQKTQRETQKGELQRDKNEPFSSIKLQTLITLNQTQKGESAESEKGTIWRSWSPAGKERGRASWASWFGLRLQWRQSWSRDKSWSWVRVLGFCLGVILTVAWDGKPIKASL